MAVTHSKLQIDVNESINSIVTAVAQDTKSRYLDVALFENGLPINLSGHTVRIHAEKADGTTSFTQGEVTDAVNGRCQFELTNQMLAVAGNLKVQISIWGADAEILSTSPFTIYILPTLRDDEAIESTNEFGALVVLFSEIQNALDLMKAIIDEFGNPGEMAAEYGVNSIWGMLEHLAAGADVRQVIKENVNSTIDTDDFAPLNELILAAVNLLWGDVKIYDKAGTYTLTIPSYVNTIRVTACAAGGGGGCGTAQYGTATTEATPGGNTIIGTFVTLIGGDPGSSGRSGSGGAPGGPGGGAGGTGKFTDVSEATEAEDGIRGKGGNIGVRGSGSGGEGAGGGGSLGDGGDGGDSPVEPYVPGGDGIRGGGGGGGSSYCPRSSYPANGGCGGGGGEVIEDVCFALEGTKVLKIVVGKGGSGATTPDIEDNQYGEGANGGNGGDGFVKISWGVA